MKIENIKIKYIVFSYGWQLTILNFTDFCKDKNIDLSSRNYWISMIHLWLLGIYHNLVLLAQSILPT